MDLHGDQVEHVELVVGALIINQTLLAVLRIDTYALVVVVKPKSNN